MTESVEKKKKHAILSPSGADRWMTCLGSVELCKGLPDTENDYSREGTDYHEVAAVCLEEGTDAIEYVGRPMLSGALVTEDNAKMLQEGYIDVVRAYAAEGTLLVEEEVPISHLTGEKGAEGTSDAVIIKEDRELIVVDLKFGRGVEVSPDDNRQCKIYALGVIEKHGLREEVDTVRLVICQPRVGDGKPKEWTISMADLLAFGAEVNRTASSIIEAAPGTLPLVPSEKACRFCKAKALCPALASFVENEMLDGFTATDKPIVVAEKIKAQVAKTHPTSAAEVLGRKMDKADLIEIYVLGIRSAVETELLAGRPVIGEDGPYKLVQGKKGNRKWASEEEAEKLLKSFRLTTEEMYDMKVISPTTADKLLSKSNPRRWLKLQPLITQSEGAKHVANAKDPRPAIETEKPEEGFVSVDDGRDLI